MRNLSLSILVILFACAAPDAYDTAASFSGKETGSGSSSGSGSSTGESPCSACQREARATLAACTTYINEEKAGWCIGPADADRTAARADCDRRYPDTGSGSGSGATNPDRDACYAAAEAAYRQRVDVCNQTYDMALSACSHAFDEACTSVCD
jgi:hypothetical protein